MSVQSTESASVLRPDVLNVVGEFHSESNPRRALKVDMSKANFVTREDFNKEFDAWNDLRLAGLKTKK